MAVEKGKVIAELNKLFQGKSVSKELKEKYAARWAEKIENDEAIEAFIKDREDDVLDASKEADKRATDAAQKAKQDAADILNGKKPKEEEPAKPDEDAPAWAKSLLDKVNALEAAKTTESLAERFKKDERLKGVPEFMLKGRIPTREEDFEASAEELKYDYTKFATENKIATFGKDTPAGGGPTGGDKKEASKEDLDAAADKLNIKI